MSQSLPKNKPIKNIYLLKIIKCSPTLKSIYIQPNGKLAQQTEKNTNKGYSAIKLSLCLRDTSVTCLDK